MRTMILLALAASACGSSPSSNAIDPGEAKTLLIDRNWLDVYPETRDDRLHVYRFVPSMGGGVFQDRTLFKGTFELFSFTTKDDVIEFDLHQTNDKVRSRYRIEAVDGPKPFDLKLTISDDPRGPHTYYGMRRETAELKRLAAPVDE